MKTTVGIVLFNPNYDSVISNINKLKIQFDTIILFDNSEYTSEDSTRFFTDNCVVYMSENKNLGIAYALNRIMEKGKELGYEWVITLDQDSSVPYNMNIEYERYFRNEKVGILCPQVIDKRRKYMKLVVTGAEYASVEKCITSASCTRISAWEQSGKYDELLFIDLVDNDFSKRVKIIGYDIYRVNAVLLEQEFGVIEYKDTLCSKFFIWLGKTFQSKNIAKLSYKKKVSPLRIYYTNRNVIYLNKRHHNYGGIGYESYNCHNFLEYFIKFNTASFLRGEEKIKIAKAIINGTKDGKRLASNAKLYDLRKRV
jgi:GT2 family glycosyltransferase